MGRDVLTWHWHGRGVSTRAVRSAWPHLLCPCSGGVDTASRRTLEDPVEARCHPLVVVAIIITVPAFILTGGLFFRFPLFLDLDRRASSAWRSRFFFFFPLFLESLADFCFSADWRRLSRSTSSSFTGGLEDQTSICPYQNKGQLKKGIKGSPESSLKRGTKAMNKKVSYQGNRALIRPHGEAIDVLRLKVAGNGRPNLGCGFVVHQSLVGHPAHQSPGTKRRAPSHASSAAETSAGELSDDALPRG